MNWQDLRSFFEMGGYGAYVWPAYALTLAAMALEPLLLVLRERRARARVGREPGEAR
jgi:heme exporter protein CcmD